MRAIYFAILFLFSTGSFALDTTIIKVNSQDWSPGCTADIGFCVFQMSDAGNDAFYRFTTVNTKPDATTLRGGYLNKQNTDSGTRAGTQQGFVWFRAIKGSAFIAITE